MIFNQIKQKYGFILGHCPALSKVEIERVLGLLKIEYKTVIFNGRILIIEAKDSLKLNEIQERLGGTIKISNFQIPIFKGQIEEKIIELMSKRLKDLKIKDEKFQFGFSVYPAPVSEANRCWVYGKYNKKEFEKLGISIKRKLKDEGVKSRFVVSREQALSSVIIQKEKLIEQGADLVIVPLASQFYIGCTASVQKFEDYSRRDYGRPKRDDKSGMLPPKLAKIMLNIGQADFSQTILDPFCGSGTILQEALLLGYKNIIGSDIDQKAVEATQNNINWLKTNYSLDTSGVKILQLDSQELSEALEPESVDVIVTEPFLGSPRISNPKLEIQKLEQLYLKSFKEFYKVLKNRGQIVIIFPVINGQLINILNEIKELGFEAERLSVESRGSVIYFRPGQKVLREIFVFKKI